MYQTNSKKEKIILFLTLFFPVLLTQFANFSSSFIDTVMTGHYSVLDLAGVSLAINLWFPFMMLCTGILSAIIPIVGRLLAQQKEKDIRATISQFLYIGGAMIVLLLLFLLVFSRPILALFGSSEGVQKIALSYLSYLALGIIALIFSEIAFLFLEGIGLVKIVTILTVLSIPLNAFYNYCFIYGHFGMPELGGAGSGLGTAMVSWTLLVIIVLMFFFDKKLRRYRPKKWTRPDYKAIKNQLKLGLPIGGTLFSEIAVFSLIGLFISKFSSQVLAAHQSAMNVEELLYIFPLSVSNTMTIIVSYELGKKQFKSVKTFTQIGRLSAILFSLVILTLCFLLRGEIASLYSNNQSVKNLIVTFLTYALFFQFGDALAAPIQGILRGYKDTKWPFWIGVSSYFLLAIPLGLLLDIYFDKGPYSYWIGLIIGLLTSSLLFILRYYYLEKRQSH